MPMVGCLVVTMASLKVEKMVALTADEMATLMVAVTE